MIDFELNLPKAKKKTRDQIAKDWMIDSAKRPSSKGAYDKFKKRITDARKKDILNYVNKVVADNEVRIDPKIADQEIFKNNINHRVAKKATPPVRTAGITWNNIKNSSIYKLLDNPKVMSTELGHEALIELIHLAQGAGLLKKGGRVK